MTIDAVIMLSGALIALIPFLGFPIQWDNIILVVLGVLVIGLGIMVRRRTAVRSTKPKQTAFAESDPAQVHEAR